MDVRVFPVVKDQEARLICNNLKNSARALVEGYASSLSPKFKDTLETIILSFSKGESKEDNERT